MLIFSTTLLVKIKEVTEGEFPISPTNGTVLILAGLPLTSVLSMWVLKYFGRKTLMLAGHIGYVIVWAIAGISMLFDLHILLFLCVFAFMVWFVLTEGAMAYVYPAEVCVDSGMGLAVSGPFISMMAMSFTL